MTKLSVPVTAEDHALGGERARVTLLEYGDYQCPHCATAHGIVKRLEEHYGQEMRFVFRNFPLTEIHPLAEPAAEAAEFAGANGRYWEMHDSIFEHQRRLSLPMLVKTAEALGLDGAKAKAAVEEQEFVERIEGDVNGAERMGVHATPTFFINGTQYEGEWAYEPLAAAIDAAL